MREIFVRADVFLAKCSRRERLALFFLPLVLCAGIVFVFIMPKIDFIYEEASLKLSAQEELAQSFATIPSAFQEELRTELEHKNSLLTSLQQKALKNTTLAKKLSTFSNNVRITDSRLSFLVLGDVEILEDVLEDIESSYFVFVENLTISAPFASSLEMKFDILNFGNRLYQ